MKPDSGDSASSSSVIARTGAEIIIPDDRRHSGRVAREIPDDEDVIGAETGVDVFLLNTLKNPFTLHLPAMGTCDPDDMDEGDDPAASVEAKNGFSTTIEEDDDDSNDENSNDGSDEVDEEEDDDAAAVGSFGRVSREVGAIGAIGEVKHGFVKLRIGVDRAIASGASKLSLESSVDGDGSSTTEVPILDGRPRAFGRGGSPMSIVIFLFPFWLTVVSGSLEEADGDDNVGWSGSLTADPSETEGDDGDGDEEDESEFGPGNTQ